MTYAFLLSQKEPKGQNLVVPVLSIPRADFNMRPEVHMLLQHMAGTTKAPFVFVDDFPAFKIRQNVDVYLVDHNTPSPQLTAQASIKYNVKGVSCVTVFVYLYASSFSPACFMYLIPMHIAACWLSPSVESVGS